MTPAGLPVSDILSPAPIGDGPWGFPALLRERRIVGISALSAPVERGRIRRIERSVRPQALRQVGISNEQTSERDQVRVALLEPSFRAGAVEPAGDHQHTPISAAYHLAHVF